MNGAYGGSCCILLVKESVVIIGFSLKLEIKSLSASHGDIVRFPNISKNFENRSVCFENGTRIDQFCSWLTMILKSSTTYQIRKFSC